MSGAKSYVSDILVKQCRYMHSGKSELTRSGRAAYLRPLDMPFLLRGSKLPLCLRKKEEIKRDAVAHRFHFGRIYDEVSNCK